MIDLLDEIVTALKGRYEVERELGHGGMAVVYLAHDVKNGRKVALKVLRPHLADALGAERFLQEIAIAAPLVHPNIIALHDSGEADGFLYYTMPYVEGPTLRQRLEQEVQLPIEDAVSIARQVAAALDYAHRQGAVHRDIKPDNILLLGNHVLVADFGLARAITRAASKPLTTHGIVVGTPPYMSPEQCTPGGIANAASDIYSLGCVVFEMIAGMPPFRGATVDVILSHHQMSDPPSLCGERRTCPAELDAAVRRALAKAPADRFRTAGEFAKALESVAQPIAGGRSDDRTGTIAPVTIREGRSGQNARNAVRIRRWGLAAVLVLAVAMVVAWRRFRAPDVVLDPSRIVVFPLRDERRLANDESGEAVATYIGYALEETRPLKWLEAWDLMEERTGDLSIMRGSASRKLSERAGAAYYIDGTILRGPDSVTVVLRLHGVRGDSVLRVAGASGPVTAYLPKLGLRAVADLLPAILQPGRTIDLRSLNERKTSAIANFLQGEREYRRMQFSPALAHYESAVGEDSAFAIAALKGAQTATWISRPGTDTALVGVAVRRNSSLTGSQARVASGLQAYLTGNADSAITHLRVAIQEDPSLAEAWTLLGEVYLRSLTSESPADSLARASLQRARKLDPDFAPALLLLEELALRDGDFQEVERLKEELRRADADTTHAVERDLMWRCVRRGPTYVKWADAARLDPTSTLNAGRILARGASQPACARAALTAVFQDDSASLAVRHGALLGLNGLLLATGNGEELRTLFASKAGSGLKLWQFYLQNAAAGVGFEREASVASDSLGRSYGRMEPKILWMIGSWIAQSGDVIRLREVANAMRVIADSSLSRQDLLIASLIEARLQLVEGDSGGAIAALRVLRPSGARRDIAWRPWEGLGLERLLLAELLLARGEHEEAARVASQLDATEPVPYLLYLRRSIELRRTIAQTSGNGGMEAHYTKRLKQLDQ